MQVPLSEFQVRCPRSQIPGSSEEDGLSWLVGPTVLVGSSGPFPEVPDLPARADRRGCVCPVAAPRRALRAAHGRAGGQEEGSVSDLVGPPFCRTGNRAVSPGLVGTMTFTGLGPAACSGTSDWWRTWADPSPLRPPSSPAVSVLPQPKPDTMGRSAHIWPSTAGHAQWCHRPGMQEDGLGSWHGGVAVHQECASREDNYAFGGYAQ